MPEFQPERAIANGRTAWILKAPGAGDNHQLASLAGLIAEHHRWLGYIDPVTHVLRDRILPGTVSRIPENKRAVFTPPWPELVLIAGGRSVVDALRIRTASGGYSRIVCIGRPWAPLHWFDLVVTTPQYQLPSGPPVFPVSLPLNLPDTSQAEAIAPLEAWHHLPRPWVGVLLGGDSGSYRFDQAAIDDVLTALNRIQQQTDGSLLIVGSPRTPALALDQLERKLSDPHLVHRWRPDEAPAPYPAVLKHADRLAVTADSASMLAEAVYSGKPVSLLPLKPRLRSRLLRSWSDLNLPGRTLKKRLIQAGYWIPARDLNLLHCQAHQHGLIQDQPWGKSDQRYAERLLFLNCEIKQLQKRITQWFEA